MRMSRRHFLRGATASAIILSLTDWLNAQPTVSRPMRSDVNSQNGKKMLALYKRAVAEMRSDKWPAHHPFSWTFQANIHDYPVNEPINVIFDLRRGRSVTEKQEIAQHRALALGTQQPGIWRTCSHHKYEEHFLSWHRMYVYCFERIVEKLVGEPFALPYWTYAKDSHGLRTLPSEFVNPQDGGEKNPLYYIERNPSFLPRGTGFRTGNEVSAAGAFRKTTWLDSRSTNGFSFTIEQTPHGNVHVAVGTTEGMGDTPKAARDPIFWLHHSNIDRLWESWRGPGADGKSDRDAVARSPLQADWRSHDKFAFAGPGGERIEMSVLEVLAASKKLGTQYDRLDDVPAAMGIAGDLDEAPPPATTLAKPATGGAGRITTEDAPVTVGMSPAVEPPVALGFGQRPSTRYSLIVEVEAEAAPGGAYDIYIKVPREPGAREYTDQLVGTFHLFGAHKMDQHALETTWKVDVTDLVRDRLVDPRVPGDVTFRARYATPKVPVAGMVGDGYGIPAKGSAR
jgi:tyrosinase